MSITTFGIADRGVQGWSLSLENRGVEIIGISDEGAVIRETSKGGLLDVGFLKYEIVDPGKYDGGSDRRPRRRPSGTGRICAAPGSPSRTSSRSMA